MKKIIFLFLLFLGFQSWYSASGSCSFPWVSGVEYRCYPSTPYPTYYSFSGSANTEYYSPHRLVKSSTGYYITVQPTFTVGNFTVFWTDSMGTQWDIWNIGATGATGPIWPIWPVGATGSIWPQGIQWIQGNTWSVNIQGTVNSIILNSSGSVWSAWTNISYSGVVLDWYFNNFSFQYNQPSFNIVLHLNAFWVINDPSSIVLTDSGMEVASTISINDFSDPRIVLSIKRIINGSESVCGWYWLEIPSSLIQWFTTDILPNLNSISFGYEVVWCEWYNQTTPIFTGSTGTGFTPPSASWSYIALTYKDDLSGATYFDMNALFLISIYLSWILALFYAFFTLFKNKILWSRKSR